MMFYLGKLKVVLGLLYVAGLLFHVSASHAAEPLSIELAKDTVDITTGFNGADVVIFGVKRGHGDIAVVLQGPEKDITVRRKENFFGAWINRSWVKFGDIPLYYDYALSDLNGADYKKLGIGTEAVIFEPSGHSEKLDKEQVARFQQAYLKERERLAFYPVEVKKFHFIDDNFFKVLMHLPANVPKGEYKVSAHLIQKNKISYSAEDSLRVGQVGFSAKVLSFSQKEGLIYACVCILIALMAGWLSNKIARRS